MSGPKRDDTGESAGPNPGADEPLPQARLPVAAIIGRPNVGKSSLFNCLAGSRISIEDPTPGTTRDRVSFHLFLRPAKASDPQRTVELVDAAGIGATDEGDIEQHVQDQIQYAIEAAHILLFVVDVKEGLTSTDKEIARQLRRTAKPVLLIANKADAPHQDALAGEFGELGLGQPKIVSAQQKRGLRELRDHLRDALPPWNEAERDEPPVMKLAIVGKRNSGKSSLVNFFAGQKRVIVSEIEGTTRDSVDVHFKHKGLEFIAIDTAGLQRERSVKRSVDFFGQARSMKAIRRADVTVLLMDCLEQTSRLDRKLVEECLAYLKPFIIAINKWDLAGDVTTDRYRDYITTKLGAASFAPLVFMSVKNGLNCRELIDVALDLHRQAHTRVGTGELNRAVREAHDQHHPKGRFGMTPKLFYATQVDVNPVTIVVFVNDTRMYTESWREYLKNRLRERFSFSEAPIKILFRKRERVELQELHERQP